MRITRFFSTLSNRFSSFFEEEPEDTPLADAFSKTVENPSALFEHLNALRKHLFRAAAVVIIATALAFALVQPIMAFLARPLEGGMEALTAIDVTEPIGTVMRVALLSGFAVAFPYIALEVWLFIAPGVSRRSRIMGLAAIPVAALFFLGGMAFAYFVMLPVALPFLLNFMGIHTIPRPSSYFSFVTSIMFWIGLAFEFPLVIFILATLGIVNGPALAKQWKIAILVIALIAAAITPTVDPVNMGLVMGPMIILFIMSIGLAYLAQRGRQKRKQAEE